MSGNVQTRHLATVLLLLITWFHIADARETDGVIIEALYRGEVVASVRGGASETWGANYLGLLDILAIAETEGLGLWKGGRLLVYAQDGHGQGITDSHVGDAQALSNIDAGDFTQLSEIWYEQGFWGQRIRVKLGKQDANTDFGTSDYTGNFVNSSFGLIPTVPIPTYPEGAPGVAAFARPLRDLQIGTGIYNAAGDPMTVGEIQWRPAWFRGRNPGAYRIGYWRVYGEHEPILTAGEPRIFQANQGVYLNVDQWVFHESGSAAGSQGLALAVQFGWAPGDRNEISRYLGGAVTYAGLIPGRDSDVTGLGVARASFCDAIQAQENRTAETAVEMFYRFQATGWFALQSDAQYIMNPNGIYNDAVALGLRFELGYGLPLF